MRVWLAMAAGAAALGGCSFFDTGDGVTTQPAVYALPPATAWMLVTPPDDPAVAAIREALETLPQGDGPTTVAEADPAAVKALLAAMAGEVAAPDKARVLVERSVQRDAPVSSWRRVRQFPSAERCHETRKELQTITREASGQIDVQPGMPMWRLEWAFLEWSNRWSQCVPVDVLDVVSGRPTAAPPSPAAGAARS